MRAAFVSAFLLPFMNACAATQGSFPSLAPRAVERELAGEQSAQRVAVVSDDPALTRQVAELVAQARRGQSGFEASFEKARTATARAGAVGSEGWIEAQLEMTRAEAARGETIRALAELDALGIARARQPTSSGDMEAVMAALAQVQALANRQQEQLESLRASLSAA